MNFCNQNKKKKKNVFKSSPTHPLVTFSSPLIGQNTVGSTIRCVATLPWMRSYCSSDVELLFLGCGATVPITNVHIYESSCHRSENCPFYAPIVCFSLPNSGHCRLLPSSGIPIHMPEAPFALR